MKYNNSTKALIAVTILITLGVVFSFGTYVGALQVKANNKTGEMLKTNQLQPTVRGTYLQGNAGDTQRLQPAQGVKHYQNTYNPQSNNVNPQR